MIKLEHKYEFYLPDKYADKDNNLFEIDIEKHIDRIMLILSKNGINDISIRTETGYYTHSNGNINKTANHVLYFYTCKTNIDVETIIEYIKNNMHQETVLVVYDSIAYLY